MAGETPSFLASAPICTPVAGQGLGGDVLESIEIGHGQLLPVRNEFDEGPEIRTTARRVTADWIPRENHALGF